MHYSTIGTTLILLVGLAIGKAADDAKSDAFQFEFTSINGEPLALEEYRGRPVFVVNTASLCGFTYQYEALQDLWETYRDRGLVLLGVPSNDFGGQEPGSSDEIKQFCEVNFAIDFPMTEKVHVRGPDSHPLFAHFRQQLGEAAGPDWNFYKFLIAPDGSVVAGWPSQVAPGSNEITGAVNALLLPASERRRVEVKNRLP